MKIYRKDKHTLHNVVYEMVVLLTIAIVATWIYKGVFPIQAIVGYGIVLGYAAMLKGNQTYVEMDDEGFRVINIKDSKYNKSFNLEILESISIRRVSVDGYALEIRVANSIQVVQ